MTDLAPLLLRALPRGVLALILTLAGAGAGAAEPYRLTAGDRLQISWVGAVTPSELRIDIDGTLRLPAIGAVAVSGLTLDESETAIETAITKAGLFVDPRASVAILEYAPVLVSGDVSSPGSYAFVPNLTVGSALGLSGGSRILGIERTQLLRARGDVEGRLVTINNDIMSAVTRIARLEAQRDGEDAVALSPGERAVIPAPDDAILAGFLADELAIFENDRGRAEELVASWDSEIASLEEQKKLFDERIAVQNEVVASVAKDLESARTLRERGLQTEGALSRAEQVDAEARSRALELESALITVQRGIAEATRQRAQFLRAKKDEVLTALREQRTVLSDLLLRYGNAQSEGALLADGNSQALLDSGSFELEFTILRARKDAPKDEAITLETPLWPGDALVVRVRRAANGEEG